jgi:hypothetical protein
MSELGGGVIAIIIPACLLGAFIIIALIQWGYRKLRISENNKQSKHLNIYRQHDITEFKKQSGTNTNVVNEIGTQPNSNPTSNDNIDMGDEGAVPLPHTRAIPYRKFSQNELEYYNKPDTKVMFDIDFTNVENAKTMRIDDNGDIIWGDFVGKHHTEIPNQQEFNFETLDMQRILRHKCITVKGTNTIIAVQTDDAIYYFDSYEGKKRLQHISEDSSVSNSGSLSSNDDVDDDRLVTIQRHENESTQDYTWANYYAYKDLDYSPSANYKLGINLKHIRGMLTMTRNASNEFFVFYEFNDDKSVYIKRGDRRITCKTPIISYIGSNIILAVIIREWCYCYHEKYELIPFQYMGEIPPNLVYPWEQGKDTLDNEIYNADSLTMRTEYLYKVSDQRGNITVFSGPLTHYENAVYVPLKHPDYPNKYALSYVPKSNWDELRSSLLA